MRDPRITQLAKNLINYSCALKPGEKVYIESFDLDYMLVSALIEEAYNAGGLPFARTYDQRVQKALQLKLTKEHAEIMMKHDLAFMKDMDAYIGVRGSNNIFEHGDIPSDKKDIYAKVYYQPVHLDERVNRTKWVVLRYPNPSMAQSAGMSTEAFEDFYFNVCNLDYGKMDKAMDPLAELMRRTDRVHIKGPGTDLTFSIKGIGAVKCSGERNIPDGEVYSCPQKTSVNGVITYNTPSLTRGIKFDNIRLEFKDGKIINAESNYTAELNNILNTDEGARYVGEFAIGVNPYINKPMLDTLFDEKINGSIHFTPGDAYEETNNGNVSAVHWDLVLIQTPEYGGGEIWFDGKLIRKDGVFVLPELLGLNAENLK